MVHMIKAFNSVEFIVLISLIIVDIITGLIVTIAKKSGKVEGSKIESKFFLKGLYFKLLNICIFIIGAIFSFFTKQPVIEEFIIFALIGYESISILENFNLLNAPFPEKFKKFLSMFSDKKEGD